MRPDVRKLLRPAASIRLSLPQAEALLKGSVIGLTLGILTLFLAFFLFCNVNLLTEVAENTAMQVFLGVVLLLYLVQRVLERHLKRRE